MANILASLLLFYAIFILGAPHGVVHWFVHILAMLLSLVFLYKFSRYYLFWFILVLCFLTASEPRYSVEYFFLFTGFMSWGFSDWWLNLDPRKKKNILLSIFATLFLMGFLSVGFTEKGALEMWFPIFLALYFDPVKSKSLYTVSGILILFSNKVSTLLAFLAHLINRFRNLLFVLITFVVFSVGIFYIEGAQLFFERSINSRAYIWLSSIKGFIASPFYGHGFNTFILDYPPFKIVGNAWATLADQQIAHAHSLFFNTLFELGVIGVILLSLFFYLVYSRARKAFIPLLVLGFFDIPLTLFGQFLLASLILAPFLTKRREGENETMLKLLSKAPKTLSIPLIILTYVLCLYSYVPSAVGHYFYDLEDYDNAIKWDKENSLYYFVRGTQNLSKDLKQSLYDLKTATELSPGVGYFYGFHAAAQLASEKNNWAQFSINKAIRLSGNNPYWTFLKAFAFLWNENKFVKFFNLAIDARPEILNEVRNPNAHSGLYIGSDEYDVRVLAFYRKGPKLYLPLPYIENCPEDPRKLRKRLINARYIKKNSKKQL